MDHDHRKSLAFDLRDEAVDGDGGHVRISSTVFSRTPMPSISMRTTSPCLRYRGGSKPMPTPAGVPVAMMSPVLQRHPGRDRRDDRRDVEDQQAGIGALADIAVDEAADRRVGDVDLVLAHGKRPHRTEGVLRLGDQPLAVAALQIARGDVVDDGIAPDMVEGILRLDAAAGLADDDGEFRLVVDRRSKPSDR